MYDLLTASEIRKRFRTTTSRDFSLKAIHDVAQKIGYKQKHIGSKVGYHKSVYTALTRHFWELVEYNEQLLSKTQQKPKKQVNTDNYYTYNGERDNVDYDWERSDESISNSMIKSAINEAIDELELYHGSQASFERKGVNENVSNETVNSVLKSTNPNYVDLKTAVRNFNKWFKGSKVVEANGDPLLCYHGTPKGGFYVFNTIEGVDKKTKWQLLFGSHFTNDKEQGEFYMGDSKKNKNKMLYTVFLSIKNPLDVTKNGEHSVLIRYTDGTSGYDRHPEMIDKIDSILSPRMVKKYKFRDSHCEGYVLWNLLNGMTPYNARKLVEALGFDGIKYDARYQMGAQVNGYYNERTDVSWIALYPNQIKSASENSGMFSSESDDIREGRKV